MAEAKFQFQFSAITRTAELLKSISSTMMIVVDEAHIEANSEGLHFRSMDPSHVALIDISCPAVAFEKYECISPIKFGFRVSDFAKVIKRAGSNDSIDLSLQNDSTLNIKTSGSYTRNYKLKLIENNSGSSTPLPKLSFDAKLIVAPSILDRILSDLDVVNNKVTMETTRENPHQIIFSTDSELGNGRIVIDDKSGIENLNEISVLMPSKATYSTELLTRIIKSVGSSCQTVIAEYSTNKPLKLGFVLSNAVKIEFFMAPRIED